MGRRCACYGLFMHGAPVCVRIVQNLLVCWVAAVALVVLAAELTIGVPLCEAVRRCICLVA
jgi:hypothetical protein